MPRATSYSLTSHTIVASVGTGVFCLDLGALGRTYRLHERRPDAALNLRAERASDGRVEWRARAEATTVYGPQGLTTVEPAPPALIRVDAIGPLESTAGFHDSDACGGWSDGHDALSERLCDAFAQGDVLLVIDGPGGAAMGIVQGVEAALAAKAQHARRCTVYVRGMEASAHKWWGAALADETFLSPESMSGSIGARGEHLDVSGAMAIAGVKRTYFADPPDKVALASDFPLTPVGAMRGNRDVSLAATAFRAAICASPLGIAHGLTQEYLIELGADMLTGQAAVDAGLADGVEFFPAVVAYALKMAESKGAADAASVAAQTKITGASRAKEQDMKPTGARAEGDEKPDDEKDPESMRGSEIPTKCGSCGVENPKAAKFCMGCSESMATKPAAEDAPPPSSKPAAKASPATAKRMVAPKRVSADAGLATILRASGDTPLAIKTAAIDARVVMDAAIGVTGETDPERIALALMAHAKDSAALATVTKATDDAKRRDLANRLNATGIVKRTMIFADADAKGEPLAKGEPPRIRSTYARMDLDVLEGLVLGLEGGNDAAPKPRDPFQPSRDKSREDAAARAATEGVGNGGVPVLVNGKPTAAQIAAAKTDTTVLRMFNAQSNTRTLDVIAENYVIAAAENGAAINSTGGAS